MTQVTDAYLYALEVGNRVDESVMLTTVSLLESTLSAHYAIRQAINLNFSSTSTSIATRALLVLESFSSMVQDDLVSSGMKLLNAFSNCYNQDRNNFITAILTESSVCAQRFSILTSMFQSKQELFSAQDYTYINQTAVSIDNLRKQLAIVFPLLNKAENVSECSSSTCNSSLIDEFDNLLSYIFLDLKCLSHSSMCSMEGKSMSNVVNNVTKDTALLSVKLNITVKLQLAREMANNLTSCFMQQKNLEDEFSSCHGWTSLRLMLLNHGLPAR